MRMFLMQMQCRGCGDDGTEIDIDQHMQITDGSEIKIERKIFKRKIRNNTHKNK
jgi:hypothetical protein